MKKKKFFDLEIVKKLTSYEVEDSLNLSILLSEGKETNRDFLSSGERTRKCPRFKIWRLLEVSRIVIQ